MKLTGIGYMIAGTLGVIFFTMMSLEKYEERAMISSGAAETLWTISGRVESAAESVGLRKDFVLKLDADTMTFVGGGVYPTLYEFGSATTDHIKEGDFVTVTVERERFMQQRIEAQRGRSNEVPIASLSTPTEQLLILENYLSWRKRDSLTGLFLMPILAVLSFIAILMGWKHRKEKCKRIPTLLTRRAAV